MRVYISGPMTGYKNYNAKAFNETEAVLLETEDVEVVNPVKLSKSVEASVKAPDYIDYMREDLRQMLGCDCVVLLDGWNTSWGAMTEIDLANRMKIPVYASVEAFMKKWK